MGIIIGSSRHDERGKLTGGKKGDQTQKLSGGLDMSGEVSMQDMYKHTKGWYIIRPVNDEIAESIAYEMILVCNNPNYGYNQNERLDIVQLGTRSIKPANADCGTTVRAVVHAITKVDPGNFDTSNERSVLLGMKKNGSKLFVDAGAYVSQEKTPLYNGDILVTKTKGHTAIVCGGNPRKNMNATAKKVVNTQYYPKYTGSSTSIIDALSAVGEKNTSLSNRKRIAVANGLKGAGTAEGNSQMLLLLRRGTLKKA